MGWLGKIRERLRAWRQPLSLGARGERAAARYLKRLGYIIVARSQRGHLGEIDLVAVDGRTIVFVEVKTRAGHAAGHPAEAVDTVKQQRLTRLALAYLKRHDLLECAARFDVVAITWPEGKRRPVIEHIKDAFPAIGSGSFYG
jgi:putative endonuclease